MINWSLKALLDNVDLRTIDQEELVEIREKYGDERRSLIEYSGGDVSIEEFSENVHYYFSVTLTNLSNTKLKIERRSRAKKVLEQDQIS
jgi:DNA gyrase subunit A